MSRSIQRSMAAIAAAVLLVTACSGDSDDESGVDAAPATTSASDGAEASTPPTTEADAEAAAEQVEESQEALAESECPVDALDAASGPVTIQFWHAMPAQNEATLLEMVDQYNASQDRVVVELVFQGSYADTFDAYRVASDDDRPELIQLEETAVQAMIDSDTVLPVQSCVEASGYDLSDHLVRVVQAYTVGEVLWPMPFNTSNPVLWYDGNAFVAAGLDPDDPPATLAELRTTVQALVDSGVAPGGIALDIQPWVVETLVAKADTLYANNDNGRSGLATEMFMDSPEVVEIVTWWRDMVADGLMTNTGRNPDASANFFAFIGDAPVGLTMNTSAALGSVLAQLPILAPDLDLRVAPLPGLEEVDSGGVGVGGGALWIPKNKAAEEIAASWDFAAWLNEPEQQATWHIGTGYLPIRVSATELPEVQAIWEEIPPYRVPFDQLADAPPSPATSGLVLGPHTQIRDEFVLVIERILLEGGDPVALLAELDATAEELLADYRDRTGR